MRLGLAACVWLLAASALAAPRVAVHPLVVLGGDARAIDQSRADFIGEAASQPIQMVSRTLVGEVLAKQPGGTCRPELEGCLEILCRETGATYALLTTLMLDGPNFVLGARVVAANGTFVKAVEALTIEKDLFAPRAPQVQAAFKKLFAQLDLGRLPEQVTPRPVEPQKAEPLKEPVAEAKPPTAEPEPVAVAPVPAPVEVRQEQPGKPTPALRVVGLVLGGVALVGAGVGTVFALQAKSEGDRLRSIVLANGGLLPVSEVPAAQGVDRNTTLATGLYVGAGVAAAAAVALVFGSMDWSPPVAIAPVEGGAVLGLAGSF